MRKCIKSENVKFKVSYVAYALIAAVAASATLTVHAADRNWIGGQTGVANTPESPYTIQNLANWDGSGETRNDALFLSVTERTYIQSTQGNSDSDRLCKTFCPNSGEFVFTGPLWNFILKAGNVTNSTVSILKKSGDWTFSLTSSASSQIGVATNSTVVFTNESGNVNVTASDGSWHKIGAGVSSYAKVVNLSGNWTFANNNNLILAGGAGSTGIVENVSGNWSVSNQLRVADTGYGEFTQYGGSLTVGGDLYICYSSSGSGVLTIKGGTVTVPSDKSVQLRNCTGTSTINLDGGTLVTPTIIRTASNLDLNFNGGTLKANAPADLLATDHYRMVVHVNAGGGVIDCGGYAVTLKPGIGCSGDTGSLTFTGGNIITIDNNINYGGVTYIASNTTVKATKARISTLLSHGVALVGALELNTPYTILASTAESDDWSSLDRSKVTCPSAAAFTAGLGADGKSITVTVTALKTGYWTGAAGDNNLSTAGNWSDNNVPLTGNAVISNPGSVTLTKGANFAATSITFAEGCSPVTIDGDFTTLTCVTNNSSVNQTFAGFVDFGAGNIDVTATAELSGTEPNQTVSGGCVVFAGGVKGAKVANHSIVAGNYTLTTDEAFIATNTTDRFTINENSSLSVKNAGDTRELYICDGATFNVADFSNVGDRLWNWNKGTFIVTNFTYTNTGYFCLGGYTLNWAGGDANANAVLKAGTLTIDSRGTLGLHGTGINSGYSKTAIFIGEGGVNIASGKAGYYVVKSKTHKTTLRPWNSDFTFGSGSTKDYDFILGEGAKDEEGSRNLDNINFTLHTDDEVGVPRTITMDARIKTTKDTSSITVAGHGTNIVTSASPLMTGTYAVTDAATVKFTAGAGFANDTSRISLDDGTTLEYTNDGNTLALPCSTLVLPESGKAALRINGERLRGGDHILVEGVSAGAASHLNVELADSVKDGRRCEVAVKDGNLVLTVNSGLMVFVK